MPKPSYRAVIGRVPEMQDQLLVCLGRPQEVPPLPEDRLLALDTVDGPALGRIAALNPARMGKGVVVVTTYLEYLSNPRGVSRAHKLLALLYTKYVGMPAGSTRIPDPLGLRAEDTPPEYLHLLNRYRNAPLFLRHPLVDKLQAQRAGLPCLLLLPGPSLRLVKDRLPELARRHLVVTISRALPFLRACGVEPDVLVQLDTVPLQEHFHHPDERFARGVLLALSIAPVHNFAPRFRQTFFIDSFDLDLLPNPARLRESWLSSLLACLGAAEALCAPKVLVCGADLRFVGSSAYYSEQEEEQPPQPFNWPPVSHEGVFVLSDAQGMRVDSTLQMFATAAEAEIFAQSIQAAHGTEFRNLSPLSLLDPGVYPPMSVEQALAAPVLDKEPFLAKADKAAAMPEPVNLAAMRQRYANDAAQYRSGRDLFCCLRLSAPEAVEQHPCHRYIKANVPWFRPKGAEDITRLAANLSEELCRAAAFARNVAALYCQAAKGAAVPVLCTAEEEAGVAARLAVLFPGWKWRFMGICAVKNARPEPSAGALELKALGDWMRFQDVLLVAPACAREHHYALSLVRDAGAQDLEELLAYAPLQR